MLEGILFTRKISTKEKNYAQTLGMKISSVAFITTQINEINNSLEKYIIDIRFTNWVFTSAKAVAFLKENINIVNPLSEKKIYAVGEKTAKALLDIGLQAVIPEKANSKSLVELLAKEKKSNGKFLYFAGNLRMNVIIDFFKKNDIYYKELCVYETIKLSPDISVANYKFICFCSPSAVESYFCNYTMHHEVEIIAIGETTAKCIREKSNNNIIIADESNILSMIDKCKEYYK